MKKFAKILLVIGVVAACLTFYATEAKADTTQNNTTTINCTTGSYGQNTCYSTNNQTSSTVLGTTTVSPSRSFTYTNLANSGMDPQTTVIAITTLVTTAGGAILSIKKKIW